MASELVINLFTLLQEVVEETNIFKNQEGKKNVFANGNQEEMKVIKQESGKMTQEKCWQLTYNAQK